MIRYIPFLKAKRGELTAIGALAPDVKAAICPFLDFPRKKAKYDTETYAKMMNSIFRGIKRHWGKNAEFYFDDFDIDELPPVKGHHQYAYALNALKELQVIPVVALNRTKHNHVVAKLKRDGEVASNTVAFRVEQDDFADYEAIEDQIDYDLATVFKEFKKVDLVLDCRLCNGKDASETGIQIATFAGKFCKAYDKVRNVIVTGSSIPASSSDLLETNTNRTVPRKELAIIRKARDFSEVKLIAGDYTTVSPCYSDADLDPKILLNIMTARLTYTFEGFHYFIRGQSIKSAGYEQYTGLAKALCNQTFFRGPSYSMGDEYLHQKSQGLGGKCMPGVAIKPSVAAHITYMALDAKV